MKKYPGQLQNRRQLLARALRYMTLGSLGGAGGSVLARRRRLVREDKCVNNYTCRGCRVFESCVLPQALSAGQALARRRNGGR